MVQTVDPGVLERFHKHELLLQELRTGYELAHEVIDDFKTTLDLLDGRIRDIELANAKIAAVAKMDARRTARRTALLYALLIGIPSSLIAGLIVWAVTR